MAAAAAPAGGNAVGALLTEGATLLRNPASRIAFLRRGEDLLLFADGAAFPCAADVAALAERLSAQDHLVLAPAMAPGADLLAALLNQGSLLVEEPDED